jgi:hypothetical protein
MPKKRKAIETSEVEILEDAPPKARKLKSMPNSGRGDNARHAILLQSTMMIG